MVLCNKDEIVDGNGGNGVCGYGSGSSGGDDGDDSGVVDAVSNHGGGHG